MQDIVSVNLNDRQPKAANNSKPKMIAKIRTNNFSIIIFDSINKRQLSDLISVVQDNAD